SCALYPGKQGYGSRNRAYCRPRAWELGLFPVHIEGKQKYQGLPNATIADTLNGDSAAEHAFSCRATQGFPWISFLKVDYYSPGLIDTVMLGFNSQNFPGSNEENYIPEFTPRMLPVYPVPKSDSSTISPTMAFTFGLVFFLIVLPPNTCL
ncbi:hypothetical protein AYI68_g7055, partial [Smittium mucronatum]